MARLSISKAWEEAAAFLAREARLVAPVALAAFMVPATLFGWYNPSGDPSLAGGGLGWPLTMIVLILAIMGQMVIAGLAVGWSGSVGAALAHAFKRVWGVLGTVFLIFVPLTIVLALLLGLVVGGAGITDATQVTPEALAAVPGFAPLLLAMMLVFLFAAVRLFPMAVVGMLEMANPLRIIARCWHLTRGHFFRLLGTLLLILIASIVASIAVAAVVGSLVTIVSGAPEPFSVSALLVALVDVLAGALISAISAVLVGRIYAQLSAPVATVPEVSREGD